MVDLAVVDAGDVVMPSGDTTNSLARLEEAVHRIATSGAVPVVLGGDHTVAPSRCDRGGPPRGLGTGLGPPFRRPCRHRRPPVRIPRRPRHPDAPADRV